MMSAYSCQRPVLLMSIGHQETCPTFRVKGNLDRCILLQGAQQRQMHDVQGLFVTARATQPEAIMKMLSHEVVQCYMLQNQMKQEGKHRCQHMSMPYAATTVTCSLTFCHGSPAYQGHTHTPQIASDDDCPLLGQPMLPMSPYSLVQLQAFFDHCRPVG